MSQAAFLNHDKASAKKLRKLNREITDASPAEIHDAFVTVFGVTDAILDVVITGKTPAAGQKDLLKAPAVLAAAAQERAWLTMNCPKAMILMGSVPGGL